jgi:predicted small lipoprotein YifL
MRFFPKPVAVAALFALGAATLCGCGQKGPLYLRDQPPAGLNPEGPAPYKPVPYPPDEDSRRGK